MNSLITTYCTTVLIDQGCEPPQELIDKQVYQLDAVSLSALLKQLEELVATEYLVLVTDSDHVAKQVAVFNDTLTEHYICLIFQGKLEADLALREYERLEMQVMDDEGRQYFLNSKLTDQVYATQDGRIIFRNSDGEEILPEGVKRVVFKRNNAAFGFLLPDDYSRGQFCGDFSNYQVLTVEKAFEYLLDLLRSCGSDYLPKQVLFFEKSCFMVSFTNNPTVSERKNFIYKLLTGKNLFSGDALGHLLDALLHCSEEIPNYILELIERDFLLNQECSVDHYISLLTSYLADK